MPASAPMATGIRTGTAARPAPPPPTGWVAQLTAAWQRLGRPVRQAIAVGSMVLLLVGIGWGTWSSWNQPVPLYATSLAASDLAEVTQRLTQWDIPHRLQGSQVLVPPSQRSRLQRLLLAQGLPRRTPVPEAQGSSTMLPSSTDERHRLELLRTENELVEALRQVDVIADARVKLVPADPDATTPGAASHARASVQVTQKPGVTLDRSHVQAILNLVSHSVQDLSPDQVQITDTQGRVWNDGQKILVSGNDAVRNELLELKLETEKQLREKLETAMRGLLGSGRFVASVNADLDYARVKIFETRVGGPGDDNKVDVKVTREQLVYDGASTPPQGSASPAPGRSAREGESMDKVRWTRDVQAGKVERTAVLEPGAVRRVVTTVVVDGPRSQGSLEPVRDLAAAAVGFDPGRGDELKVHSHPIAMPAELPPLPASAPTPRPLPHPAPWLLVAVALQGVVLVGVAAVFWQRRAGARRTQAAPVATVAPPLPATGIADLETPKAGPQATATTTACTRSTDFDRLAREKPTQVAELLRSTWLAERER